MKETLGDFTPTPDTKTIPLCVYPRLSWHGHNRFQRFGLNPLSPIIEGIRFGILGRGDVSINSMLYATISAIIEETYQNGNYYIKGSKEMLIEGQKQKIIVSGVIRPYDILIF